jgi:hypothetical protein
MIKGMATQRQKKLAKVIVENSTKDKPINAGQMLEKVGYSDNLVKQPGRVIESEGVQEELKELGFTEENAKRVVKEIMLNENVDPSARLKATDQVFKVKGSYAPEKRDVKVDVTSYAEYNDEELRQYTTEAKS